VDTTVAGNQNQSSAVFVAVRIVVCVRTRTASPGFRLEAAQRTEAHAGPTDELLDREGGGRGAAAEEARGGAWCGGRDGGDAWVPVDTDPDLEIVDDEHSRLERGHDFRTVSRGGAESFLAAGLDGASGLGLLRSISRQMVRFLAEEPQGGGTMARRRRSGGLDRAEGCPRRRASQRGESRGDAGGVWRGREGRRQI
jgi:hypothetical protein